MRLRTRRGSRADSWRTAERRCVAARAAAGGVHTTGRQRSHLLAQSSTRCDDGGAAGAGTVARYCGGCLRMSSTASSVCLSLYNRTTMIQDAVAPELYLHEHTLYLHFSIDTFEMSGMPALRVLKLRRKLALRSCKRLLRKLHTRATARDGSDHQHSTLLC